MARPAKPAPLRQSSSRRESGVRVAGASQWEFMDDPKGTGGTAVSAKLTRPGRRQFVGRAGLDPPACRQLNGVWPGLATGATGNFMSHWMFFGKVSSFELSAISQVISLPV